MYIVSAEKNAQPKKLIKRPEALKIMSKYYLDNKKSLPKTISNYREEIINSLMNGSTADKAFNIFFDKREFQADCQS